MHMHQGECLPRDTRCPIFLFYREFEPSYPSDEQIHDSSCLIGVKPLEYEAINGTKREA